jgi:hypothetical protein
VLCKEFFFVGVDIGKHIVNLVQGPKGLFP